MPILSIKLHQPAAPMISVRQQTLIHRLNEGLAFGRPITLVSAPAGFGKTTCISEWLSRIDLPVAWISLDAEDNDPGRFLAYLAAALKRLGDTVEGLAFPSLDDVEGILRSGELPPPDVIAAALINDLSETQDQSQRFLLVLDDFHLIQERAILQVFEKLIAGLFQPNFPQPMHLVLITREDPALPLARLRAGGRLTEIRAEELRLSTEEAECYLTKVLNLRLSLSEVQTLEDRTEGWIAGLQLAGLSIRGRSNPSEFVRSLSGSHRFILGYLTEEVLNHQTAAVQQFLLDTSILDRMCGELCNAVTQRTDSAVVLEQLRNANLFLVPLDDEQRWYRYHHLFRDLLRSRQTALHGEKTTDLHRRAAAWYANASAESERMHGAFSERVMLVSTAIEHALTAADYAMVVRLIEKHAMEITSQWYAKVVDGWMQSLPSEWAAISPRANLIFARHYLIHNNPAKAAPYLNRLQELFAQSQDGRIDSQVTPSIKASWLALQSTLMGAQGKPAEALELAGEALRLAPNGDSEVMGHIYLAMASAHQQLGSTDQAMDDYQKLIQFGRASGDMIMELLGISTLTLMLIENGKLHHGFALALQGVELVEQSSELPPISASIYGELGQVSVHWNRLEDAERYFQRAAQVMGLVGFSDIGIFQAVVKSRLALVQGDLSTADQEIQAAISLMRADAPAVVREEVIAQQVQVLLAQGDVSAAEYLLAGELHPGQTVIYLPTFEPGQNIPYSKGVLYNSALRILLARGRGANVDEKGSSPDPTALEQGLSLANILIEVYRLRKYVPHTIEAKLLRAQIYQALGSETACLDDIKAVLDIAEPEGYISPFLVEGKAGAWALEKLLHDCAPGSSRRLFIQTVLDAFTIGVNRGRRDSGSQDAVSKQPQSRPHPGILEALTARELDVLRLMAGGYTYDEIASRLVVSINTVRTHIKAIYGKLGANNRTSAIETANQMKIL